MTGVGAIASSYAPAGGGFAPTDIAGCTLWLDAADTATITDAGSGAVSAWADKSGNGNHATQATSGSRPTTGTVTINGLNTIDFDGTDDWLDTAAVQLVNATTGAWTMFAVARLDTNKQCHILNMDPGSGNRISQFAREAGALRVIAFSPTVAPLTVDYGPGISTATDYLFTGRADATNVEGWVNGASAGGATASGHSLATAAGGVRIGAFGMGGGGASELWDGPIGEAVIYNVALGTTDRQTVETHLATKWGL